jgi:hypothetical protein
MSAALLTNSGSLLWHQDLRPDSALAGNARYTAHECRRVRAPATGPSGVARRRRSIQHRQDALLMLRSIFRLGAAITDFRQTCQTIARITNSPLRRCADRYRNFGQN